MNDNRPPPKRRMTALAATAGKHITASLACFLIGAICLLGGMLLVPVFVFVGLWVLVSPALLKWFQERAKKQNGAGKGEWRKHLYVTEDAPFEVVQAAYRALAFTHHPDRDPSRADKMQQINAAWTLAQHEYQGSRQS